jgi:hypothetical protein
MSTRYGLSRLCSAQTVFGCILLVGSVTNAHADAADEADQSRAHGLDPVLVTAQALHGPQ